MSVASPSAMDERQAVAADTLRALQRGDRAAFEIVARAYSKWVRRLVSRFVKSSFEQEDLEQEVWLTVLHQARSWDPQRGSFTVWLATVTNNRCRDVLRAKGRVVVSDELPDVALDLESGPEHQASRAKLDAALEAFCQTVPTDEGAALRWGVVGGATHDELAVKLGVSVRQSKYLRLKVLKKATADADLARALREFREVES